MADIVQYIGLFGVLITAGATIAVALISKWRTAGDTAAVSADTIGKLVDSVNKQQATIVALSQELERERQERIQEYDKFEQQVIDMRESYRERAEEIERAGEMAIRELRRASEQQIAELRTYYEEKIGRLEQAHRDRVQSLKERIKVLERQVNGDCEEGNGNNN